MVTGATRGNAAGPSESGNAGHPFTDAQLRDLVEAQRIATADWPLAARCEAVAENIAPGCAVMRARIEALHGLHTEGN